ncbi:unnamed protein product [Parajaminaea phylloscopi]
MPEATSAVEPQSQQGGHPSAAGAAKTARTASGASSSSLPPSNLQRMDPDSILAHEADPDTLLGAESDSEAGGDAGDGGEEGEDVQAQEPGSQTGTNTSNISSRTHTPPPSSKTIDTTTDNVMTPTASTMGVMGDSQRKATHTTESDQAAAAELKRLRSQIEDLSNQVTGLNGKLVNSYMRISDLEDDLSDARERVMTGSTRVAELEKERQEHLAALNTGLLVEKVHVSTEMQRMMDRVIEETKQRGQAESDKAKIEAELDELSASLFNEANRMVAVEKLARARAEEKSKSMEERLQDTEGIMLEQQKVLGDLQQKLEAASDETNKGEQIGMATAANGAASGGQPSQDASRNGVDSSGQIVPAQPAVMLDVVPYQELRAFLNHLRKLRKQMAPFYSYPYDPSRPYASHRPTGSTGVLNGSSASAGPSSPGLQSTAMAGPYAAAASPASDGYHQHTSPFVLAGVSRHKDYPTLPSNCENLVHIPSQLSLPFVKRAQEEDSEPCLRLDFAPGLNWLTRRTANTAILEGNLVIEPVFSGGVALDEDAIRTQYAALPPAACAMCGIPVVNVPLPGGEEAGRSGTPDLRAVTSWAQSMAAATGSAAYSLREAAGGSGSSNAAPSPTTEVKPPLKSSRSGLFSSLSSLRSKAGSPKPSQIAAATTPETIADGGDGKAATGTASSLQTSGTPAVSDMGPLPVPTHIFRLSETGTSRYLLCPHHCLVRLRAACAFWGYLRNLERAVVLEGKLAWDDEKALPSAVGSAPASAQPAVTVAEPDAEPPSTVKEASEALSGAVGAAPTPSEIDTGAVIAARTDADDTAQCTKPTGEGHESGEDDDAGFHDATSATDSPPATASDPTDDEQTKADDVASEALAVKGSPLPRLDVTAANADDEGSAGDATPTTSLPVTPTVLEAPPPVPPRRGKRVVPAVPAIPPTLPPRSSEAEATSASAAASSFRRSLPLRPPSETELSWEEKVYLEVIRLKHAMWEARAGIDHRPPPVSSETRQEPVMVADAGADGTTATEEVKHAAPTDAEEKTAAQSATETEQPPNSQPHSNEPEAEAQPALPQS